MDDDYVSISPESLIVEKKKTNFGKRKGNSFERLICKKLSMWWSGNERDDLFWRTHNSGGRHTVREQKDLDTHHQVGDVTNTHPDGELFIDNFIVECKHYRNINLWGLITNKKDIIFKWWDKLSEENKDGKMPWLIIRENGRPIILITDQKFYDLFGDKIECEPKLSFSYKKKISYIYLLEDILSVDRDIIRQALLKEI